MTTESWRPIVGYEGLYEVSNQGRVRALTPWREQPSGRIRKPYLMGKGYLVVELSREKTRAQHYVHRLVAAAFCERKDGQPIVRHLDGNPLNNQPDNLAWGTYRENNLDAVRHGTHRLANKTHCPQGHPYDEANTQKEARGYRACKECRRAASREFARRMRSAA